MYIDAVLMVLKRDSVCLENAINMLEKIDYAIYTASAITAV